MTWFPIFRAWDIKDQQMWFQEKNLEFGITILEEILKDRDRFVLMQWTGVHDIADKMIFEGDIIEGFGVIEWYMNREESYSGWTFVDLEKGGRHEFWYLTSPLVVLGNRHQNPEIYEESLFRKTRRNTEKLIESLKAAPGSISTLTARNESGTLWEQLWKFEDGKFFSKVVSSGCTDHWGMYTEETALYRIDETLRIIERVR